VQVTGLQYLFERRFAGLAPAIAKASSTFEEDMAVTARAMSDDVSGNVSEPVPDVQQSADKLKDEINKYYAASGQPIPPPLVALITLTQNLASISAPLYKDIHATFIDPELAVVHHPHLRPQQA
jgi:hypothetical protein